MLKSITKGVKNCKIAKLIFSFFFSYCRCGWEIISPEAVADIHVTFHFFDLTYNKRCDRYDHVHVYKKENGATYWDKVRTTV